MQLKEETLRRKLSSVDIWRILAHNYENYTPNSVWRRKVCLVQYDIHKYAVKVDKH